LCGFLAFQAPDILSSLTRLDVATRTLELAAAGLLILHFWAAAARRPIRTRLAMLAAQALVTYFPLFLHPASGQYYPAVGWLAGSALLTLTGRSAWLISGLIAASAGAGPWIFGPRNSNVTYLELKTIGAALIIYGFSQLTIIARRARADGDDIAQLAVIKERMRIARDLHDLLGYSLSAIILKAELAGRVLTTRPDQAREETSEVIRMARQALDDVRLVSRGYRHISLAKEAKSVTGVLAAAGIRADVEVQCGPLEPDVDAALATVLREALTNVLRHSNSQSCTVKADRSGETIRLRVTNDGIPHAAHASGHRDSQGGLANLDLRLHEIRGHLTTGTTDDGRFELIAEVPAQISTTQAQHHASDLMSHKRDDICGYTCNC
jgi:two-component system sensor histidine kinase DesK